jgi:murein peptide amidase A
VRLTTRAATFAVCLLLCLSAPLAAGGSKHVVLVGETRQERKVWAVRRGGTGARPSVLVIGCIHGDERAGIAVVKRLRRMKIPNDVAIWTIRSINPDGAAAGTRQNSRGVDLNRNFPRKWKAIGEPWDMYYSGSSPSSERETRMARRFILKHRPDITIWYHQSLRLVDKSGASKEDVSVEKRYARLVNLPFKRLSPLPGTATRWQNHRLPKTTAFVVELAGGRLSARKARRHARAVIAVGRM